MFAVHYKFKSSKDTNMVTFDSPSITLAELKERILEQNNLKKTEDFDLKIVNSETGDDYSDTRSFSEHHPIMKHTSVIVSRVPVTTGRYRSGDKRTGNTFKRKTHKILSPDYICHRCGIKGHFIQDCPTNGDPQFNQHKVKMATGIPKTFLKPVTDGDVTNQTLRMANGSLAVMRPSEHVFEKNYKSLKVHEDDESVPNDYKCPLCKGILNDPLLIPCCGYSFCSECISPDNPTDTLLCPTCKRVTNPSKFVKNKGLSVEIEQWLEEKNKPQSEDEDQGTSEPDADVVKQEDRNGDKSTEQDTNLPDQDDPQTMKADSRDDEYSRDASHDSEMKDSPSGDSDRYSDRDRSHKRYDQDYPRYEDNRFASRGKRDDYRNRDRSRFRDDRYRDDDRHRDSYRYRDDDWYRGRYQDRGPRYGDRRGGRYKKDRYTRRDRSSDRKGWRREREREKFY